MNITQTKTLKKYIIFENFSRIFIYDMYKSKGKGGLFFSNLNVEHFMQGERIQKFHHKAKKRLINSIN